VWGGEGTHAAGCVLHSDGLPDAVMAPDPAAGLRGRKGRYARAREGWGGGE